MTQEAKANVFEFDPLPGDPRPADARPGDAKPAEAAAPAEPKKRGRKPKTEKKERKKRGPRRVQASVIVSGEVTPVNVLTAGGGNNPYPGDKITIVKTRKARRAKADLPEIALIKVLMELSDKQRERVLSVLTKVFG